MINYIKKNTRAYISKLELYQTTEDIKIDLSEYKFSSFQNYLVYLIHENKIIDTFDKKNFRNVILLTQNDFKKIYLNEVYIVILPLDNQFSKDFHNIESYVISHDNDKKNFNKILNKVIVLSHLSLPFIGMILLSSTVTTYSKLFGVPLDMIDISSQINILYKIILMILLKLGNLLFQVKSFIIIFLLLFLQNTLSMSITFYRRRLYKHILKTWKFIFSLLVIEDKESNQKFKIAYLIILITLASIFIQSIKELEFSGMDSSMTEANITTTCLHERKTPLFSMMVEYNTLTAFPEVLKLESGKYILVKAVKDDLVYFHTLDDLFENLKTDKNRETIFNRLCIKYDQNITYDGVDTNETYKYDLIVGLENPKVNIAPTSILIDSTNGIDAFYNRADELKSEICKAH